MLVSRWLADALLVKSGAPERHHTCSAPPIRKCRSTAATSTNPAVPPVRGPPKHTLSHDTFIVPCPSPASTHRPPRRWPDCASARDAASQSPATARTIIVVRMVTPLIGFRIPISYPAGASIDSPELKRYG